MNSSLGKFVRIHTVLFIFSTAMIIYLSCGSGDSGRPQILVSPKGYAHAFWQTVKAGVDSAAREFPVEVIWNGPPNDTQIAEQIGIVETYLNKNIDGMVLDPGDVKALVPVAARAHAMGIPVVTIDGELDSDIPVSYVATDNVWGAAEAARQLVKLIGGKGEVALIPFSPGAATSILRERGFTEELAKFPAVKLVATQYSMSDPAKAMSVTEDILTAHPGLDGIFAAAENCAIGVIGALTARGMAGKVKVVAFDASDEEIAALKGNVIQALIVQDPFRIGYIGVKTCYQAIIGETVPKRIDTGITVVTGENLESPEVRALLNPMGEQ